MRGAGHSEESDGGSSTAEVKEWVGKGRLQKERQRRREETQQAESAAFAISQVASLCLNETLKAPFITIPTLLFLWITPHPHLVSKTNEQVFPAFILSCGLLKAMSLVFCFFFSMWRGFNEITRQGEGQDREEKEQKRGLEADHEHVEGRGQGTGERRDKGEEGRAQEDRTSLVVFEEWAKNKLS